MSPEHLPSAVTQDRVLGGRLVLCHARRLADFGAGVGSAGLAALLHLPQAEAVLIEIDPALADLAGRNVVANGFSERCGVVCADVLALARPGGPPRPAAENLDLVLANPPFNVTQAHQTSPDAGRARAHMADAETLRDWATAAYRCLAPGGTLAMILRPEDLSALLAALEGRFGAVRLLPVHPRPEAPAVRLIARAIKGRRTAPAILPGLILAEAGGAPGARAQAILSDGAALDMG
ncbi:MAG: hypothetical protein B7Y61_23215 [Rhizobiales bacterium 35-66-30]|nr:MAG: hypothetical protein B7Y61_23215 [Rhizobiales bacterium 35-66-30]